MEMRKAGVKRGVWWLFLAVFIASGAWLAYYLYSATASAGAFASMGENAASLRNPAVVTQLALLVSTAAPVAATAQTNALASLQSCKSNGEPVSVGDTTNAQSTVTACPATAKPAQTSQPFPTKDPLLAYYQSLAATNPDMFGWVSIADTVVNYPVMYTPGNPQLYLHKNFEKNYSFAGLPFLDAHCDPLSTTQNSILYAHNMHTGQMFAQLLQYLDADFLALHPVIGFDSLQQRRDYTVFAVLQVNLQGMSAPSMQCYRVFDTATQKDVDALNTYVQNYAAVQVGMVSQYDSILTLSTCQHLGDVDRLVVMARRTGQAPAAQTAATAGSTGLTKTDETPNPQS